MRFVMKQHLSNPKFIKKVHQFMVHHDLFPKSGKAFVAVSGGVDSIVLLHTLLEIQKEWPSKIKRIEVLHVNHKTRGDANDQEEESIRRFCEKQLLPLRVFYFDESSRQSGNFELKAREFRLSSFNEASEQDDLVYLGHHLNDSFEWSLMQQFKSSEGRALQSIPFKTDRIARPLSLCYKEELIHFSQKNKLVYFEDSSNKDSSHERNFMRNEIIPKILERYPKAIENYASRLNDFLVKESHHLERQKKKATVRKIYNEDSITREIIGIELFINPLEQELDEATVRENVRELSQKKRGVLRDQVCKLIKAQKENRFGPLSFSGGVKAYLSNRGVLLLNFEGEKFYQGVDGKITKLLELNDEEQINKILIDLFPYLQVSFGEEKRSGMKRIKRIYPLFPNATSLFLRNDAKFFLPL